MLTLYTFLTLVAPQIYNTTTTNNSYSTNGMNGGCAGGSEKSKVGIAGDSGGGTISSSVAHDVPGVAFEVYKANIMSFATKHVDTIRYDRHTRRKYLIQYATKMTVMLSLAF